MRTPFKCVPCWVWPLLFSPGCPVSKQWQAYKWNASILVTTEAQTAQADIWVLALSLEDINDQARRLKRTALHPPENSMLTWPEKRVHGAGLSKIVNVIPQYQFDDVMSSFTSVWCYLSHGWILSVFLNDQLFFSFTLITVSYITDFQNTGRLKKFSCYPHIPSLLNCARVWLSYRLAAVVLKKHISVICSLCLI